MPGGKPKQNSKPKDGKSKAPKTDVKGNTRANQRKAPDREGQVGAAIRDRLPQLGLSDLIRHRITYLAGYVYVGNGTVGTTNAVLFQPLGYAGARATTGGLIPIAPADAYVGATYVQALEQLYRRKVYRGLKVHLRTVQSSTTNNAVVGIAPVRGPPGAQEIAATTTGTTAGASLATIMSMQGFRSCSSFENLSLDLMPYVAGGAGGAQSEFAVAAAGAGSSCLDTTQDLLGVVPAAFLIGGNSTVAGLQGTYTHYVVIEMVCDYLDFVGAKTVVGPVDFAADRDAKRKELLDKLKELSGSSTHLPSGH